MSVIKVLLIGNSGVGKSSLLMNYVDKEFDINKTTTIGVDFKIKSVEINGKITKIQIWDTAGQDRFRTITTAYYRGTSGFIVVYDVTNAESFHSIKIWIDEISKHCDLNSSCIYIVGNKNDLKEKKIISSEIGKNLADKYNAQFLETSALSSNNIEQLFCMLTLDIIKKRNLVQEDTLDLMSNNKHNCCNIS